MEFFDFTGTNEEEKAQALEIIHQESSGVEFYLNYATIVDNNYQNNNNNHLDGHSKSTTSYLHVNGDLSNNNPSQSQSSSSSFNNINHHHHHQHHSNHSHHRNNNRRTTSQRQPQQINDYQPNNPLNEWDGTTSPPTNQNNNESTPHSNSNVLLTHANMPGGMPPPPQPPPPTNTAATQYIFSPAHPYFAAAAAAHPHPHGPHPPPPPPNHPHYISIHAPPPPPMPPNQTKQLCLPSGCQMIQNIVSSSSIPPPPPPIKNTTTSNNNNNNKNNNTTVNNNNNTSSCDIRSFIPPPSQYSCAPQLVDGNRLKSVSGDGSSNILNDPTMVSNGTPVPPPTAAAAAAAVPPHLGPPYHHNYAFQTHALQFHPHHHHPHPHGPHLPPVYFIPTHPNEGYLSYPTFSPTISVAPVVNPNVVNSTVEQLPPILTATSNNNNNNTTSETLTSTSSTSSSSTCSTTTATLSNLSSISASSTSSSIPPYHSTTALVSTTTTNNSSSTASESSVSNNHHQNENTTVIDYNQSIKLKDIIDSVQVPSQSTPQDEKESKVLNNEVNQAEEYLKLCLNINSTSKTKQTDDIKPPIVEDVTIVSPKKSSLSSSNSAQINETATTTTNDNNGNGDDNTTNDNDKLDSSNVSESNQSSSNDNNNITSTSTTNKPTTIIESTTTPKPTTWASKLFPTTISSSTSTSSPSSINENNHNQTTTGSNKSSSSTIVNDDLKTIPSDTNINNNNEVKTNGDYPELTSNNKNSVINNHHYSNNRRSGSSRYSDDFKNLSIISMKNDNIAYKLAKRLRDVIQLKHSLPTIKPCGLINRGNWCYVNATLQALLACPPFYNLMREISETPGLFRQSTSTPIIDNFARYFVKFLPTDFKRNLKSGGHAYIEELLNSEPFEPVFIYDTLKHIGMIKNDAQRGHQEDAEEFLSSVLNGINEEMINLSKLLNEKKNLNNNNNKTNGFGDEQINNNNKSIAIEEEEEIEDELENDDLDSNDIWHEVGTSKHKSLPTRSAKTFSTAITEIFGGSTLDIRTVNKDKDACGNRQPFFTLQLDIKPSSIKTLDDAIRWQTKSEQIHGYTCSKTKQIIDASSQMFLENLPPILIFHLKLFDYEIETGASKKLLKTIEFPENFEIPRECVAGKSDIRYRKYKLLAVVYHNGSEVINGHYITDVYHIGLNQWLRCDDASLKVISLSKVLNGNERESSNLVPYLLFYRRFDTVHGNTNNINNNIFSSSSSSSSNNNSSNNMQANNSHGTKRMNNNNEYGHNNSHHDHHHYNHHNHNHHNENEMLMNNKFSSISRF